MTGADAALCGAERGMQGQGQYQRSGPLGIERCRARGTRTQLGLRGGRRADGPSPDATAADVAVNSSSSSSKRSGSSGLRATSMIGSRASETNLV